jgi:zinc transport system permease protein
MLDFLSYGFMQRALLAGMLVAVVAPTVGLFLTVRRYSLIADTLSHVALAGVALGALVGLHPVLAAALATLAGALLVERLRQRENASGEALLALLLYVSLAAAVVAFGASRSFDGGLLGYLFGSLLTVDASDLWLIGLTGAAALATVALAFKELFYVSTDEDVAAAQGLPVRALNLLLVAVTALVVSAAMRVVGVLLIGALMVIPVLTGMRLARSFRGTLVVAVAASMLSVLIGLLLSFRFDLAAGGAVVLTSGAVFLLSLLAKPRF